MKKIGMATGVFDGFHYGHKILLTNAKKHCDTLIVCLSDEKYTLRHKNKKPMIKLEERMRMVKEFKHVDIVDVQSLEFGKKELIEKYKPDYLFVGDDHLHDYNGADLGIDVIYLPYTHGISSTMIRKNINEDVDKIKRAAVKNIEDMIMIFDSAGMFWWITGGFLLGLYREGDMISGDEYDIDIKIFRKDLDKLISVLPKFNHKPLLLDRGRFKQRSPKYSPVDNKLCSVAYRRNGCQLDIKVVSQVYDVFYYFFKGEKKKSDECIVHVFPKKIFKEFDTIEWRGLKLNCPKDIKSYLALRYGENWKTPLLRDSGWNSIDKKNNPCVECWHINSFI